MTLSVTSKRVMLGKLGVILTLCALLDVAVCFKCPRDCMCDRKTVDCAHRGLSTVPIGIPLDTSRLDLQGNNFTIIRRDDFKGLRHLRILQLLKNNIQTIEKGAFQDLISMERLRLDRNQLKHLPDLLFATMPNLQRLDLSFNKIRKIGRRTLKGSVVLRNLQLDHNELTCVAETAIEGQSKMLYLTLNNNNLTTLPVEMFSDMTSLKVLRLRENKLNCDCHLAWLARWLKFRKKFAVHTTCTAPANVRNRPFNRVDESEFKCNDIDSASTQAACDLDTTCPDECSCTGSFIDCRDRGLTEIPENLPTDATELRMEQNHITRIPEQAFSNMHRLRRIDLSNNQIVAIAPSAFSGLNTLNTLVMYGNKITELPINVFNGLTSLQLLLLNRNKISCVPVDTFQHLTNLNLLSLYDNKIESLANGTFTPLINLQTLHLGRNPFICDCNLKWLSSYLHKHPIETSGARCERPQRMQRKKLSNTKHSKFKCKGTEEYRTRNAGSCTIDNHCPLECDCTGTLVDCSSRRMSSTPTRLPSYITQLNLKDNQITKLSVNSIFRELPNLEILDLSDNLIEIIEDGVFSQMEKLVELNLANNRLDKVSGRMIQGLNSLHHISLTGNRITCISNTTFAESLNLRKLDLFDNEIGCIQEGAFQRNTYLTSLNLMSNPFSCNCHLGWFAKWLQTHNVLVGSLTCYYPIRHRDTSLMNVPHEDFICEENNEIGCNVGIPPCCSDQPVDPLQRNCDPRVLCPDKCTCRGTVVRCSRQELRAIPQGIPLDTTELYLDANGITTIESSAEDIGSEIGRLTQLRRLDLSNNDLISLPHQLFANLSHLSTLILSYNKLQCVSDSTFQSLRELRILSLHGNNMSSIPFGAFDDLTSLTHLALGGNPLYCDCELKWLSDWIKKDFVESGIAACIGPVNMVSKLILTTDSAMFQCTGDPDPEVMSKCDVCFKNPCQHEGLCRAVDFKNFQCDCTPGYHGKQCEQEINACFGNPCMNDGLCRIMDKKNRFGRFQCECLDGFEGDRCETNINDCVEHTCQNGATCVDEVQSYSCQCPPGFTGKKCEQKIKYCVGNYYFCMNGASCIDLDTDYRCECPAGYSGKNCTINDNDCKDHICQNGANCVDELNLYTCVCPRGYSGQYCEMAPAENPHSNTGLCQQHDCQNNGVCYQEEGSSDYMCKCGIGFAGKKCEKLMSLTFLARDSYIQLPKYNFQTTVNITIVLTTSSSSGLILYTGQEAHLAVELYKGRMAVSFYTGTEYISRMFSYAFSFEKLDDDEPHTVELLVHQRNFTMRVDGMMPSTVINQGSNPYLDVDDDLYIGGLPARKAENATRKYHIRDGSSFAGCIQEVLINGKRLDFMVTKTNFKVTPGCRPKPEVANPRPVRHRNPCDVNDCQNRGRCKAKHSGNGYSCRCRNGYSGDMCQIVPTCVGKVFKDIYVDPKTNCRSRARIKYRRCEGSCGNHCCQPKKIKNRKVRMYCTDNTTYIYDLPVIRKCGCKKC